MAEILALTINSLRRQLGRNRFFVGLAVSFATVILCFYNTPAFLSEYGFRIHWGEPLLLLLSNVGSQILLILSFLLILGDAPFYHEGMEIILSRTSKFKWAIAQALTVMCITVIWLLCLQAMILLFFVGKLQFTNEWSGYLKIGARLWYGGQIIGLNLGLSPGLAPMQHSLPSGVFFLQLLYGILMFTSFGLWGMLLNLLTKRSYGSTLIVTFVALRIGLTILFYSDILAKLSPLNIIDVFGRSGTVESSSYVILFFLVQIVALSIACVESLRKRDITRLGG